MGRAPCCDKATVKRGPWSPDEDTALKNYVERHGSGGNWIALPPKAGLNRCGKSCRLRWLNYLRPDIKHGGFTEEEDYIICSLYNSIGSRWSVIASQLPGRTDNDVKNYWNTKLKKKLLARKTSPPLIIKHNNNNDFLPKLPLLEPTYCPMEGLMEAYEFGTNIDHSYRVNGGGEDNGFLMDFGFGSSYEIPNGFGLQDKTSEADSTLANCSFTRLFK